jgi:predicted alpha/beta superfamily hydrolase
MQTTMASFGGARAQVPFLILALALLLGIGASLWSRVTLAKEAEAARPVPVPNTEEHAMRSKAGQDYRIFIYLPVGEAPASGWPVVYVLDGNAWFEPLANAIRLQGRQPQFTGITQAVIVGVAYPGDTPFNALRRFYDFVPDVPFREEMPPGVAPPKMGGATQFLGFLREELEPWIKHRVKIDDERRTLFGHSLGCSFALHVLFTRPEAFRDYVCGSPSLGFNGGYVMDSAERFIAAQDTREINAHLLLYVAEYDEKMPPSLDPSVAEKLAPQLQRARIVSGARELYRKLQPLQKSGLQTRFMEIQGENHISVVPVLINRMLPIVLDPQPKH